MNEELIGRDIGRFSIREKVGQGGQASVYKAWHKDFQAWMALKILHEKISESPAKRERFKREARLQFRLVHPNIVRVVDIFEEGPLLGMAMDWVEGKDLQVFLKEKGGRLSWGEAITIFLPVLDAVGYAHTQGIIHRDIKPSNLLLSVQADQIVPKVMDFGIAKSLSEEEDMTKTNAMMGTPYYLAPEQAKSSKHIDHRADIYALGITLYEMIAGRTPFDGDVFQLLLAHFTEAPPTLTSLGIHLPKVLEQSILQALEKSPASRFSSCEEWASILRRIRGESTTVRLEAYNEAFSATQDMPPSAKKTASSSSSPPLPSGAAWSSVPIEGVPHAVPSVRMSAGRWWAIVVAFVLFGVGLGYGLRRKALQERSNRNTNVAAVLPHTPSSSLKPNDARRPLHSDVPPKKAASPSVAERIPPVLPRPTEAKPIDARQRTDAPQGKNAPRSAPRHRPQSTPSFRRRVSLQQAAAKRRSKEAPKESRIAAAKKRPPSQFQKSFFRGSQAQLCSRCLQGYADEHFTVAVGENPCTEETIILAMRTCASACVRNMVLFCYAYGRVRRRLWLDNQPLSRNLACRIHLNKFYEALLQDGGYTGSGEGQTCRSVFLSR